MTRPRILLADDHHEMREVVTRLLEPEFEIVGAVKDGNSLLKAAATLNPDLCILDITMPFVSGIEATAQLKAGASAPKVIILTIHEDVDFVEAALKSGASGYVVKSHMASDLRPAVKTVLAGRSFVSSSLSYDLRSANVKN